MAGIAMWIVITIGVALPVAYKRGIISLAVLAMLQIMCILAVVAIRCVLMP